MGLTTMDRKWLMIWAAVAGTLVLSACAHSTWGGRRETAPKAVRAMGRTTVDLGDQAWGIACLSVASAREQPEHKAEMGTQVLMGNVVHVLQGSRIWYQVETADGYRAWLEKGTLVRCTRTEADGWERAPLLIVTRL